MEIKNLKEAGERILRAIKNKERILLYGDADLDGVCSVLILKESILSLGGKIAGVYFPDRETEGYGVSEKGLETFKKLSPALLITLDCGISNFDQIKLAKKIGLEVIIIDHHEILDQLPEADIIVDPKQKDDPYPFKELANVGIVFKLSEILLNKKMSARMRANFLELVALATLADMMPQREENKIFIEEGLHFMKRSWRPALRIFNRMFQIPKEINKVISLLNVRDVADNFPTCYRLLAEPNLERAKKLVEVLIEKGKERKMEIERIIEEIESFYPKEEPIIFIGKENWNLISISAVASFLSQKYKKPVFIYKKLERESQGTVRVPPKFNSVEMMKKCKDLLISFGGHPQASGFRIKNENLETFKECLMKNL